MEWRRKKSNASRQEMKTPLFARSVSETIFAFFIFFFSFILFFEVGVVPFLVTLKTVNEKMNSRWLEFKVQRATLPFQRKYLLKSASRARRTKLFETS